MRRIAVVLAASSLLTSGLGVAAVASVHRPAPATRALTCAQPVNPTARQIVNAVCSIFGP